MSTIYSEYNELLGENFTTALSLFIEQGVRESSGLIVNSKVLPQGRYTKRAPRTTKAKVAKPVISVDEVAAVAPIAAK